MRLSWFGQLPSPLSPFYRYAEGLNSADEIYLITVKLAPFYITYAGTVVIDGMFIGMGRTTYNAVNSLIINLVYYGIFYALYASGALNFTMDVIIMMIGFGMVAHSEASLVQEKVFLRRSESQKLAGRGSKRAMNVMQNQTLPPLPAFKVFSLQIFHHET